MIGRADIEESKSDVAMNAWPPQASYPCGNFSDTPCVEFRHCSKGSIGPAFAVCIRTENRDQESFCPFALREVSVLAELSLGHLRYHLTDVPPQSNSPPGGFSETGRSRGNGAHPRGSGDRDRQKVGTSKNRRRRGPRGTPPPCHPPHRISKKTLRVVVFQRRKLGAGPARRRDPGRETSHLFYTSQVSSRRQTRVKLNRVFFPR